MKLRKWASALFAVLGGVIMAATTGMCLLSLDAEPKVLRIPQGAEDCAQSLVQALEEGDYAAAESLIYGQPDLGIAEAPEDPLAALAWEAFEDSLSVSLQGACYAQGADFCQELTVTALDVTTVTASLRQRVNDLLQERMENAEELSELYDEQNQFRQDLVDQVMQEALQQALAEDAQTFTCQSVLGLIRRDGRWWAVPDQELLRALSGNLA